MDSPSNPPPAPGAQTGPARSGSVLDRRDVAFLARYPFLPPARAYVETRKLTLDALLTNPGWEPARHRAIHRILHAIQTPVTEARPANAEAELLSYPLARALVAYLSDAYLMDRFAASESHGFTAHLAQEADVVIWGLSAWLQLPLQPDPHAFARIHFLDFLRHAPHHEAAWKLVNQRVDAGFLPLSRGGMVRLAGEAFRVRLRRALDRLERPGRAFAGAAEPLLVTVRAALAARKARFTTGPDGPLRPDAFPPCMRALEAGIRTGKNVPHMGRFALVGFLHALGLSADEILQSFHTLPDFNAHASRYQIDHITGRTRGSPYKPPSCSTMQTYGLCPLQQRDDLCLHTIRHPVSYYRKRLERLGPPPAPQAKKGVNDEPSTTSRGPGE